MLDVMASDALLRNALVAYDRLVSSVDTLGDPELGLGEAYTCGRRALLARAAADAWLVPPAVVTRIRVLVDRLDMADHDEAAEWLQRFPGSVLALLERRTATYILDGVHPRRRWVDRIGERTPRPMVTRVVTVESAVVMR